jgi:hypothetical protein
MPGINSGIGRRVDQDAGASWSSYWATRTPSDLTVTWMTSAKITLDWVNNGVADYTGISIERRTDGGAYSEIGTVVAGIDTYDDVTATNGHIYTYRIRAYKGTNYSEYSAVAYSLPDWNKTPHTTAELRGSLYSMPIASGQSDDNSTFGSLAGTAKWVGGFLAPNGCIYGIPYSSTTILKIDTSDDSVSTFGSLTGASKWIGGVLAPNGCIYGIPRNFTTILKILSAYTIDSDIPLSRQFNKL